jgi:HSP20 family molecular chaperone IbpA
LSLAFEVDANQADATFEHGIVRIVLPKAEQAKPKTIAIKAGGTTQAIGTGSQS